MFEQIELAETDSKSVRWRTEKDDPLGRKQNEHLRRKNEPLWKKQIELLQGKNCPPRRKIDLLRTKPNEPLWRPLNDKSKPFPLTEQQCAKPVVVQKQNNACDVCLNGYRFSVRKSIK